MVLSWFNTNNNTYRFCKYSGSQGVLKMTISKDKTKNSYYVAIYTMNVFLVNVKLYNMSYGRTSGFYLSIVGAVKRLRPPPSTSKNLLPYFLLK